MNKIQNKFLIFKTQQGFLDKYNKGLVKDDSIVFIKDKGLIWTHRQYFGLSTGFEKAKGYFDTYDDLIAKYPSPEIGDWAIIAKAVVGGEERNWVVARCATNGVWSLTTQTYDRESFNVNDYIKKGDLDLSQYITESDISNVLREGDINLNLYATKNELYQALRSVAELNRIQVDSLLSITSSNPVQNKVITTELAKKLEESDLEDYAKTTDVETLVDDRIIEVINSIEQNGDSYEIIREIFDKRIDQLKELVDYINKKYISWGTDENSDDEDNNQGGSNHAPVVPGTVLNMVTLSDVEYQALVDSDSVDLNTYYFTYSAEDYPEGNSTWVFGDKFPITFTGSWLFGSNFPVVFSDSLFTLNKSDLGGADHIG